MPCCCWPGWRARPEPVRRLGQELFDAFCRDMDDSLREMGVGDLAVPRRMRRIGEAFYGRQAAYRAALAEPGDGPLAAALARNVFAGAPRQDGAAVGLRPMSGWRCASWPPRTAARWLGAQVAFPDPEKVAALA